MVVNKKTVGVSAAFPVDAKHVDFPGDFK